MSDEREPTPEAEGEPSVAGGGARANRKLDLGPSGRKPARSASHIRSGARMLSREAKKILKRHRARLPEKIVDEIEATVAKIDSLRAQKPKEDLGELEYQAETLDEILHQHASFARKSTLRDTLENIGIAIAVALAVRSCVYEPFKIPSGSMMPTLRAGDHIFVNKFAYGVQIPLTTTVVGEDMVTGIERGDVIVFRYPLNERDDFIKRVIGLPGDSIRANGDRRSLEIKRAGEDHFERVEREPVEDQRCLNEDSPQPIQNCTIFRETLDGHSYLVRYRDDLRTNDPSKRTFVVPEGHLLVMGDNRNASHDSLAWTVVSDAISAASLITRGDIRDLTPHKTSRMELHDDGDVIRQNDAATVDHARYLAERRSPERDLTLEVWRAPPTEIHATFESLALTRGADQSVALVDLLDDERAEQSKYVEFSAGLGEMRYGDHGNTADLILRAPDSDVLFRLYCGRKRCANKIDLALKATLLLEAFEDDPDGDARRLMQAEQGRASTHPGRGKIDQRYLERRFGAPGKGVRIRAWRDPREGLEVLRDAALGELGVGPVAARLRESFGAEAHEAAAVTDLGADAWVVDLEPGFAVVHANHEREILSVLECGPKRCKSRDDVLALATLVSSRHDIVAKEAERLPELLGQADVGGGFAEVPVRRYGAYYWDRLVFEGAVLDDSHSLDIFAEMKPEEGLAAAVDALEAKLSDAEPVEGLGPAAWYADTPNGHTFVFTVPETELVVRIACRSGMCPDRETARKLAQRAREKGRDPQNFVQPDVSRPRPFVPRGNVKGRAEVIWWPTSRFWKKID